MFDLKLPAPYGLAANIGISGVKPSTAPNSNAGPTKASRIRRAKSKAGDPRPKILLVGNSHSKDLFNVLWFSESVARAFQIARYGCQVNELKTATADIFSSPNYRAANIVILASAYSDEDIQALPAVLENLSNDKNSVVVVENIFAFPTFGNFTLADKKVFAFMRAYSDFKDRMPQLESEINTSYFQAYSEGIARKGAQEPNQRIRSIAKARNIPALGRMDYVCDRENELCYGLNDNMEKLFYDYGHHTLAGARFFGKRVDRLGWLDVLSSNQVIGKKMLSPPLSRASGWRSAVATTTPGRRAPPRQWRDAHKRHRRRRN